MARAKLGLVQIRLTLVRYSKVAYIRGFFSSYLRFFPAVYWLILASILALFLTVLALFSHYSRFEYELKSLDQRV